MSQKTCPGTKFFGGNSVLAAKTNFIPALNIARADVIFLNALDKLVARGVIVSPTYWAENCADGKTVLAGYAATLITKATGISDVFKAIDKLVADKIITSPTYWQNCFAKNELINGSYMRTLITKLA